jgi:transposase
MKNITVLAIDIAKNHFQLHGIDNRGNCIVKKSLSRNKLVDFITNLAGKFMISMEACGGANHWGRVFQELGYEVKLISPQYVKGFLQGSKNDANDAKAIATAALQASIPSVAIKTLDQQDCQTMLRVREMLVKQRTAYGNMIRGFLLEYGFIIPKSISKLRAELPLLLEDAENKLTTMVRKELKTLSDLLLNVNEKIKEYDKTVKEYAKAHAICEQLTRLRGVGPIIAVTSYSTIGDAKNFKNGRHCSAYLGLVPREHSTGGKHKLLGISKRGNNTLRGLLIHGARATMKYMDNKTDKLSLWVMKIKATSGYNKACVALANKIARHIWAIMAYGEDYKVRDFMVTAQK